MASPGKRKLLITGVAGFTGAHLSRERRAAGWDVIGLVQHEGDRTRVDVPHLVAGLQETDRIAAWLADERPTHVVHLAAQSHVVGDPLAFYQTNVLGTESLLDALRAIEPQKVILASSANIYGNALRSPIRETDPVVPVNHYALSKATMELLARKWSDRLPLVIARPFNYTGPGQSEAFVFPKIVAAFARREPVLRLGNLDVARDVSDIRCVVEAYARLLDAAPSGTVVNVCSGRSVALLDAIEAMAGIAGFRPRIEVDPAFVRRDEIKDLCGDPQHLWSIVGRIEPIPFRDTLQAMYVALGGTPTQNG